MKQPTHKEMILSHLKSFGSLDAWTALQEYGIFTCLHARITDLKREGYNIRTEKLSGISKVTGRKYHIANYILVEEA